MYPNVGDLVEPKRTFGLGSRYETAPVYVGLAKVVWVIWFDGSCEPRTEDEIEAMSHVGYGVDALSKA